MTLEEKDINALPEAYQQKMARYCLDGWQFFCYDARVVTFWTAEKAECFSRTSNSLQTVLDFMDESEQRAERISAEHL